MLLADHNRSLFILQGIQQNSGQGLTFPCSRRTLYQYLGLRFQRLQNPLLRRIGFYGSDTLETSFCKMLQRFEFLLQSLIIIDDILLLNFENGKNTRLHNHRITFIRNSVFVRGFSFYKRNFFIIIENEIQILRDLQVIQQALTDIQKFWFIDFPIGEHFLRNLFDANARITLQMVYEHLIHIDRVVFRPADLPGIHLVDGFYRHRPDQDGRRRDLSVHIFSDQDRKTKT
ncbi:hypothetical protein D3C87_996720 [compost metagenome]